jgi:membrane-associated phospholipid phosphatase
MFNTNASAPEANNMAYQPGTSDPIDRSIQRPRAMWLDSLAHLLGALGSPTAAIVIMLCLAAWISRRSPLVAIALLATLGVGIAIEAGMKAWLLYPASSGYPSGHALRAVFLAIAIAYAVPRGPIRVAAVGIAMLVCLSRVYVGEHSWYEVVGGALAGCALAAAAIGLVRPSGLRRGRLLGAS